MLSIMGESGALSRLGKCSPLVESLDNKRDENQRQRPATPSAGLDSGAGSRSPITRYD